MTKNVKIIVTIIFFIFTFILIFQFFNIKFLKNKSVVIFESNQTLHEPPVLKDNLSKHLSEKDVAIQYGQKYKGKSYIAVGNEIRSYQVENDGFDLIYSEKLKVGNGYDIDTDVFKIAGITQNQLIIYIVGSDFSPGPCFDSNVKLI